MEPLSDALQTYFRGERHLGLALAVWGVALLAVAVWVWRSEEGAFAIGLLVPLCVLGLAFAAGGTFLAMKTPPQAEKLQAELRSAPGPTLDAELGRMARVNANWPRIKLAWGAVTLVALVLLLAVRKDAASGVGLALMLMTATLFAVDVFAERRSQPYTRALEATRAALIP